MDVNSKIAVLSRLLHDLRFPLISVFATYGFIRVGILFFTSRDRSAAVTEILYIIAGIAIIFIGTELITQLSDLLQ